MATRAKPCRPWIEQFVIQLPLDHEVMLRMGALAPHGPKRWKTVELQTSTVSVNSFRTLQCKSAVCMEYRGREFAQGLRQRDRPGQTMSRSPSGEPCCTTTWDYDGKNIPPMLPLGEAELELS